MSEFTMDFWPCKFYDNWFDSLRKILHFDPMWFSLLGTKGARKAIMLVTINDYWLYQLVPFFVMHSIYLVLGDQFCLFPNNILSRQFALRRPKRVAVPANLRVSITKADDKERLVFGSGLQKNHVNLMEFWLTFYFRCRTLLL